MLKKVDPTTVDLAKLRVKKVSAQYLLNEKDMREFRKGICKLIEHTLNAVYEENDLPKPPSMYCMVMDISADMMVEMEKYIEDKIDSLPYVTFQVLRTTRNLEKVKEVENAQQEPRQGKALDWV